MVGKTKVVPAAPVVVVVVGVVVRTSLWVDYDDVVQFSDLVVASVSSVRVSNNPSKCIQHNIC